jgi:ABC-2 type transport system ATP-binding protein
VIRVEHLVKRYGSRLAVDDVSFTVGKGEVVGFLGPNGAGKSTTLRILSGFLGMTSGKVTVAGHDVVLESYEAKKKIGYMPEAVPLYPEMRVGEYLSFRAELKQVPRAARKKQVGAAMEKARVADRATTLIGHLSKGYRQRVGLADALVSNPPLLILDEPTAGLDPNQIREVRDLVTSLGAEHTVLLSTHILSEVDQSCTRVVLIDRGKLVKDGTVKEIRSLRRSPGLLVRVRGDEEKARAALEAVGPWKVRLLSSEDSVSEWRCAWGKKTQDSAAVELAERAVAALVAAGLSVREASPVMSSLEDVFSQLTEGDHEEEGEASS